MSAPGSVFIHIVTYNSAPHAAECIRALLSLEGYSVGANLHIEVTDNASSDGSFECARPFEDRGVRVTRNQHNLGFSGGHNQGLKKFIQAGHAYYLSLNADLVLQPGALANLVIGIQSAPDIGFACPKLCRADGSLEPVTPTIIDAAGMYMTPALRHFDRGSGRPDHPDYSADCFVFGASGACLLMRREFVLDLEMPGLAHEQDVDQIYPQLRHGRESRLLLFDEAFFAYREDADLAWRAQACGWRCRYVASAVGYHVRVVTPEVRSKLSPLINLYGVRNRYLLQLNNYSLGCGISAFVYGYLLRNFMVLAACIVRERSSLPAFAHLLKLARRAMERRRYLWKKRKVSPRLVSRWFRFRPHMEY